MLLFVAYAEAKELVPYSTNARYADHSLTRLVARLAEDRRAGSAVYDGTAASMWTDVKQLWSAIDTGNVAWGLPAYNGGLFSRDADISPAGAAIEAMAPLTDAELAPALSSMLIDRSMARVQGSVVQHLGTRHRRLRRQRERGQHHRPTASEAIGSESNEVISIR